VVSDNATCRMAVTVKDIVGWPVKSVGGSAPIWARLGSRVKSHTSDAVCGRL
jgi:hypothetical protein